MTELAEKTVVTLPAHLSYSQASSMQTCSWRWVLERGLHVPQQPSWATVGGSAVHTATEWWDNWTLADEWVTDRGEIEKLFHKAMDESIEERLKFEPDFTKDQWRASGRASKAWPNKENEDWWRSEGPSQVMSWVTWRMNNPQWEIATVYELGGPQAGQPVPGVELKVDAVIGGVQVVGYIDRLFHRNQTELLVVDIKSGAREPESKEQLGTYRVMIEETYGVTPTWGAYWMSRQGGTTEFEDLNLWPKVRLDHTYSTVRRQQEEGMFLPKVTGMCNGCSVRDYCFAVNGAQSDTVPTPWEVSVVKPESSR